MANQTTIIRDLEFYWAKLDKPVSPFGTEQYDLQVRFPKKRVKEMSAYGKIKEQADGQFSINITRKAKNAKGEDTPVRVVDSVKRPLEGLIGNGSKGHRMKVLLTLMSSVLVKRLWKLKQTSND
jgi:hypothetical protein